jgi:hypothetical protein
LVRGEAVSVLCNCGFEPRFKRLVRALKPSIFTYLLPFIDESFTLPSQIATIQRGANNNNNTTATTATTTTNNKTSTSVTPVAITNVTPDVQSRALGALANYLAGNYSL